MTPSPCARLRRQRREPAAREVSGACFTSLWPGTLKENLPIRRSPTASCQHVDRRPHWASSSTSPGTEWRPGSTEARLLDRVLDIPDETSGTSGSRMRDDCFRFIRDRARERWTTSASAAHGSRHRHSAGSVCATIGSPAGSPRTNDRPDLPEAQPGWPPSSRRAVAPSRSCSPEGAPPPTRTASTTCSRLRRASDPAYGGRCVRRRLRPAVAQYLVHGCDVWLNNPRMPLEASGTSGMKAAINGVPHLSIGDGWWARVSAAPRVADRRPALRRKPPTRSTRPTRTPSTRCSRSRSSRCSTTAGRQRHPAHLLRSGEGSDPHRHAMYTTRRHDEAVRGPAYIRKRARRHTYFDKTSSIYM